MKVKFIYTGIRVKDLKRSVEFYTNLLGMKSLGSQKIPATGGEVVSLVSEDGGFALELNFYQKGSRYNSRYSVGEGLDHLAFQTDDMDGLLEVAKRMGHPTVDVVKTKSSRWAYIKDPDGIWIEIVS